MRLAFAAFSELQGHVLQLSAQSTQRTRFVNDTEAVNYKLESDLDFALK